MRAASISSGIVRYSKANAHFFSSTFKDLRPERESAQEALRRSELVPWGMELFVSEPSEPLDVCLEQVQLSDAVILIIGFMAGSLIPESPELTCIRVRTKARQASVCIF